MNMKKSYRPTSYIKWYYMLLISFCLALYLNWPTQFLSIADLWNRQIFWKALVFSWLLGFMLIGLMDWLCRILDHRFPWKQKFWTRLVWQILLGVAIPLLIILSIVRFVYFQNKESFMESGYLTLEFPVVVEGILALNSIYYSLSRHLNKTQVEKRLVCTIRGMFRSVSPEDIVILRRNKNSGYVVLKDGEEGRMDYLIEDLEVLLDAEKFVRINRSTIIAIACIKGWVPVGNGQFLLELCSEVPKEVKLTVSRSRRHTLETLLNRQLQPADD